MHVVFANLHWDRRWPGAEGWFHPLDGDTVHAPLARALAARSVRVTVVQEGPVAGEARCDGVRLVVVPPDGTTRLLRRAVARRPFPAAHGVATSVVRAVAAEAPDVVHSFDLVAYPTLAALGRLAPVVATFHGGAPARSVLLRAGERAALRGVTACFTVASQAEGWIRAGSLVPSQVVEVQEVSSTFPFSAARQPGLEGQPALLHVGRLDPVKDPATTALGFRRFLGHHPGAVLHLAYTDGRLLSRFDGLPVVRHGAVPPARVLELLHRCDLLVQASTREVCGRAAVEALATGCVPVLSDIPPFRRLAGSLGTLFPPGDAAALAEVLGRALTVPREDVRAHFDAECAWDVVAARYADVYVRCRDYASPS